MIVGRATVSAQLLVNGTPAQVKDDVKDLIDTFGDKGGLIVGYIRES